MLEQALMIVAVVTLDLERKANEKVLIELTYAKTSHIKIEVALNNIIITVLIQ